MHIKISAIGRSAHREAMLAGEPERLAAETQRLQSLPEVA